MDSNVLSVLLGPRPVLPGGDHSAAGDFFAIWELIKERVQSKLSTEI